MYGRVRAEHGADECGWAWVGGWWWWRWGTGDRAAAGRAGLVGAVQGHRAPQPHGRGALLCAHMTWVGGWVQAQHRYRPRQWSGCVGRGAGATCGRSAAGTQMPSCLGGRLAHARARTHACAQSSSPPCWTATAWRAARRLFARALRSWTGTGTGSSRPRTSSRCVLCCGWARAYMHACGGGELVGCCRWEWGARVRCARASCRALRGAGTSSGAPLALRPWQRTATCMHAGPSLPPAATSTAPARQDPHAARVLLCVRTRRQVMPRGSSIELAREMVLEVDKNNDGRVDYAEVRCSGSWPCAEQDTCTHACMCATGCQGLLLPSAQWRLAIVPLAWSVHPKRSRAAALYL